MAPTKKTVCIVGAGPSGLVAAKTLLHSPQARGRFHVTVFESQPRLGGLWPSRPDDSGGLLHPHMLANQSRHTMQFSGMPWAGVDAEAAAAAAAAGQPEPALFPRAWQVGAYLQRYYDAYCAGRDDVAVRLRCRVTRTEPVDGGRGGWHVWTRATAAHPEEEDAGPETDAGIFDYLLVATGYFGRPVCPAGVETTTTGASTPVIHSSQYRSLSTLFPSTTTAPRPGTILVVGGQFSGVDIAATIADHLSAAANAPRSSPSPAAGRLDPDACVVHHLIQRPFWVLPLHTSPRPAGPAPPPFLPLDLTSYDLSRRTPGPLSDTQGLISVDVARRVHGFMETLLGSDQAEVHPALALPRAGDGAGAAVRDAPVYLAIGDTYLEHVRAGRIRLSRGRLAGMSAGQPVLTADRSTDQVSDPPVPEDVVAVVLATGFAPADHALSFLPPALLRDVLAFDRTDTRNAAALAFHATHHPDLPHVAFVGFYRSPYWGIMEMQARLATALFVSDATAADTADTTEPGDAGAPGGPAPWYPAAMPLWPHLAPALAADRSIARTLALRADPARAAQFPMGDYVYLMDAFAQALGLPRQPNPVDLSAPGVPGGGSPSVMDVLTPADYTADDGDIAASLRSFSRADTAATVRAGLFNGRFVARAVFRALQGTWQLDRTLVSRLPSHPSGRFRGTAAFRLRAATDADADADAGAETDETALSEYLYVEEGLFAADGAAGLTFPASRRYVWRYDDARDRLSVWFARTDDASRADYLFHELAFAPAEHETGHAAAQPWQATAGHLCIDDFYNVHYDFFFAGVHLREWRLRYTVRGPKKDYTLDAVYRR